MHTLKKLNDCYGVKTDLNYRITAFGLKLCFQSVLSKEVTQAHQIATLKSAVLPLLVPSVIVK